jgi:hypothetical protein
MRKETSVCRGWLVAALMAVSLGATTACGGEDRLSPDAFNDRLQNIDREGSARYQRLAELAMPLRPDQRLTREVRQAMTRYAVGLMRAADGLDALDPPKAAEKHTTALIRALRARASAFEQAAQEESSTLRGLEHQTSITKAGERIDIAFEQLRSDGFLRE